MHSMNIRVKDENGSQWGPVYTKRAVYLQEPLRDIKISSAEFFWDTDPGEGSATPLLAFDGNYNDAIERLIKSNVTPTRWITFHEHQSSRRVWKLGASLQKNHICFREH